MIALEHSLFMLLLLVGLLNTQPRSPPIARWFIGGGVALAFVVPAWPIALPWELLSALLIPLLFWQTARLVVSAQWRVRWVDVGLWLFVIVGITTMLSLTTSPGLFGAFLFGLLVASIMWRATEQSGRPGYLGQIGSLALAFLLVEISPAVESPDLYIGSLFSGAGIGTVASYVGVKIARRTAPGWKRDAVCLGQVYLAFIISRWIGASGVAAAWLSTAWYVSYGAKHGLWPDGRIRPAPLNSVPIFSLAVVALAFVGWQTHIPLTPVLLLEVGLGLLITVFVVWVSRLLRSPAFCADSSFTRAIGRVALLLFPALLLWPREALLDPWPLAFALIAANLAVAGTHFMLTPLLDLYGWLDTADAVIEPDQVKATLKSFRVKDFMTRDVVTVRLDTPVPDIARLLTALRIGGVPVLDETGCVVGIVTEGDLFVREEALPRTQHTFLALFKAPALPELLPEIYVARGSRCSATDVMTRKLIWVKESDSVSKAVRLMARFGIERLPVLTAAPEARGRLIGILTRSDVIRLLAGQTQKPDGRMAE